MCIRDSFYFENYYQNFVNGNYSILSTVSYTHLRHRDENNGVIEILVIRQALFQVVPGQMCIRDRCGMLLSWRWRLSGAE